jgi:hypothetical protein
LRRATSQANYLYVETDVGGDHMGAQSAIEERCGSGHKSPSRAQIIFQMLVLCLLLMLL